MISIIIASFNEPGLEKAVMSFLDQDIKEDYELIVMAPDDEAKSLVDRLSPKHPELRFIRDERKGKVNALNKTFPLAKGDIFILTDGDVYVGPDSVNKIIDVFKDPNVGCLSGRPISINDRFSMLGYWGALLFDGADMIRQKKFNNNEFLETSGYLFAFRNDGTITSLPPDVAEDSISPYYFWKKGMKIAYVRDAAVFVKNPTNLKDFIAQRKRTAAAHHKLSSYAPDIPKVKSLKNEIKEGSLFALRHPSSVREFIFMTMLFPVRLYIWLSYYFDYSRKKNLYRDDWDRIESTKVL